MFKKEPHPETCPRCPHRFSDVGCPFYLTGKEGLLENNAAGESRIVKGCIWHEGHLMRWVCHMVAASEKPALVLQGWRNDMMDSFQDFGRRVTFTEIIKNIVPQPREITQIELKKVEDAE